MYKSKTIGDMGEWNPALDPEITDAARAFINQLVADFPAQANEQTIDQNDLSAENWSRAIVILTNRIDAVRDEYIDSAGEQVEHGWMRDNADPIVYFKHAKDGRAIGDGYLEADPDDINPLEEEAIKPNLCFAKPYLGLGFGVEELKDGKLILYTKDKLEYGLQGTTINMANDMRNLELVWVHPENDVINIYPTWKPGTDPEGVQQDKVELQPYEYDLFYRREQGETYNDLVKMYKQRYNKPYDPQRAAMQKKVLNYLDEWITLIRTALTNAKNYYYERRIENDAALDEYIRQCEMLKIENDSIQQQSLNLESQLSDENITANVKLILNI